MQTADIITHALHTPTTPQTRYNPNPASQRQIDLLLSLGYTGTTFGLTMTQAKEQIDALITARKEWREQARATAAGVDMIALAEQYTTLRKESSLEMCGPCPKCGGSKRFHVRSEWWFCRDCHDKRSDAVGFVMWLDGCTFDEALARITNDAYPTVASIPSPAPKPKAEQTEAWIRKAAPATANAQKALVLGEGKQVRVFLSNRGLSLATARLFGLGYVVEASLPGTWDKDKNAFSYPRQPAIAIPWYSEGKLVGVRYRFLQWHTYPDTAGEERKEKQGALYGSDFSGLWGEQGRCANGGELLVITEGEINAMSVFQASAGGVDIASIGSESAPVTPEMVALTQRYQRVVFWADREEIVLKKLDKLPGCYGYVNPDGKDANDLLQNGTLADVLDLFWNNPGGLIQPAEVRNPIQVLERFGLE